MPERNEHTSELPLLNEKDYSNKLLYFIFKYVFSTDHKIIARQYLFTAVFWAGVGGLLSILFRLQLGFPDMDLSWLNFLLGNKIINGRLDQEYYLSLVTIHGTIMIFFVLTSGFVGTFGNFLVPLHIGARDMASGIINMVSYWLFFISSCIMFISLFIDTGPNSSGWTVYPPLSALPEAAQGSGTGMTLWIISMVFFIISNMLTSLNFITTIINLRTEGMTFSRLPMTTWAVLFTAILSLFTFPVLLSSMILLFFDRTFGTSFFISDVFIAGNPLHYSGGSPILFQHLFWFLGHPEVYIAIFPAFGITSDIISTNARKPIFGYAAMVTSIFAIMILSFTVWAHHMFVSGMDPFLGSVFSLTSFIIAVPSSVKVFNWITTLWKGNIHFTPAMLFAMGMISFFISGGLTGIFLANPTIDIEVHDTYFVVAHFHLVMGSAAFFGLLSGIYYWYPKIFGRMLNKTLSYVHFWITFLGVYCIFFPMHFLGLSGIPRRYYAFTYFDAFSAYGDLNAFISVAAMITFSGQLFFILNFFYSMFFGDRAPENPWKANTLEWTTPVKVPFGNWPGKQPVVYRGPYEFSLPGAKEDFIPQNVSDEELKEKGILESE